MRIGEFARQAGTSPRAVRYDEEQGLLCARRRANGYRDYDDTDLRVVREISAGDRIRSGGHPTVRGMPTRGKCRRRCLPRVDRGLPEQARRIGFVHRPIAADPAATAGSG